MDREFQFLVSTDSVGKPLEGGKYYYLRLPPNIPSKGFWSVIVKDNETSLMIQADQPWPSIHSQLQHLAIKQDGSIDIYFGPVAFVDTAYNWLQTLPRKGWNLVLTIYEPEFAELEKGWSPDSIIELMDFEEPDRFMIIHD